MLVLATMVGAGLGLFPGPFFMTGAGDFSGMISAGAIVVGLMAGGIFGFCTGGIFLALIISRKEAEGYNGETGMNKNESSDN